MSWSWAVFTALIPAVVCVLLAFNYGWYLRSRWATWILCFLWGAVPAAAFAKLTEDVARVPVIAVAGRYWGDVLIPVAVAPLAEESLKAAGLLLIYLLAARRFGRWTDGISHGMAAGLGFAAVENLLYFTQPQPDLMNLITLVLLRGVLFSLSHALFTAFTGLGFSFIYRYKRIGWPRWVALFFGFGVAVLAHALHNFLGFLIGVGAIVALESVLALILLVILWRALARERAALMAELDEEIDLHTLGELQTLMITNRGGKIGVLWGSRAFAPWRAYRLARASMRLADAKSAFRPLDGAQSEIEIDAALEAAAKLREDIIKRRTEMMRAVGAYREAQNAAIYEQLDNL